MAVGKVGSDCELHLNSGSFATPSFAELPEAKDVTVNGDAAKGDTSGRGDNFKSYKPGRKDLSISFSLAWRSDNANIDAFRQAFDNKTSILLAALDGADDETGAEGWHGSWSVFKFVRAEPDDDGVKYDVEIAPDDPSQMEWYIVS